MATVTIEPGRAGPAQVRIRLLREDFSIFTAKGLTVVLTPQAPVNAASISRSATPLPDGDTQVNGLNIGQLDGEAHHRCRRCGTYRDRCAGRHRPPAEIESSAGCKKLMTAASRSDSLKWPCWWRSGAKIGSSVRSKSWEESGVLGAENAAALKR
jgi:hypothetical protein